MLPDFEVLDSKIASVLENLLAAERNAQQDNRFLKGRQIAYLVHEYFKIIGTGEPILDFSDL